jgi:hypothetical protein
MIIKYETLILDLENTLHKIVNFLTNITWTNNFLKHENFIGSKILVSDTEWSTSQIKRPIYKESLSAWSKDKNIIYDTEMLKRTANMMYEFGYDLTQNDSYEYLLFSNKASKKLN